MWFSSSTNKVAFTCATMATNINHDIIIWQKTSTKNIHWFQTKSDNNICHIQHPKKLAKTYSKNKTHYMAYMPTFGKNSNQNYKE